MSNFLISRIFLLFILSTCKIYGSSEEEKSSSKYLFVDYDDTLCPSTHLIEIIRETIGEDWNNKESRKILKRIINNPNNFRLTRRHRALNSKYLTLKDRVSTEFKNLNDEVSLFFDAIIKWDISFHVVTHAKRSWLEITANLLYSPKLAKFIIDRAEYTRERSIQPDGTVDFEHGKYKIFFDILDANPDLHKKIEVTCIGDGLYEYHNSYELLTILKSLSNDVFLHRVKMIDNPQVDSLIKQLNKTTFLFTSGFFSMRRDLDCSVFFSKEEHAEIASILHAHEVHILDF